MEVEYDPDVREKDLENAASETYEFKLQKAYAHLMRFCMKHRGTEYYIVESGKDRNDDIVVSLLMFTLKKILRRTDDVFTIHFVKEAVPDKPCLWGTTAFDGAELRERWKKYGCMEEDVLDKPWCRPISTWKKEDIEKYIFDGEEREENE